MRVRGISVNKDFVAWCNNTMQTVPHIPEREVGRWAMPWGSNITPDALVIAYGNRRDEQFRVVVQGVRPHLLAYLLGLLQERYNASCKL